MPDPYKLITQSTKTIDDHLWHYNYGSFYCTGRFYCRRFLRNTNCLKWRNKKVYMSLRIIEAKNSTCLFQCRSRFRLSRGRQWIYLTGDEIVLNSSCIRFEGEIKNNYVLNMNKESHWTMINSAG